MYNAFIIIFNISHIEYNVFWLYTSIPSPKFFQIHITLSQFYILYNYLK